MKYHTIFAQAYGQGDYNGCTYNDTISCTTTSGGGTTGGGSNNGAQGGLADTGISLVFMVSVACLLIFAGLVVKIWRRKPVPVVQEVEEIEDKRFADRF